MPQSCPNLTGKARISARRLLVIGCLAVVLGACGIKYYYNQLDWLVPWYLGDYVSLEKEQKKRVKAIVRKQLAWHRQDQLPRYASWIEQVQQDLVDGLQSEEFERYQEDLEKFGTDLGERLLMASISDIQNISDAQVEEFLESLAERAEESQEELNDLDTDKKRIRYRTKLMKNNMSDWLGRLNKSQKAMIDDWAPQIETSWQGNLDAQVRWREALGEVLRNRNIPEAEFAAALRPLALGQVEFRTEQAQQRSKRNFTLTKALIIDLVNSATDKQKKRLNGELEDYAEDFLDLHNDD